MSCACDRLPISSSYEDEIILCTDGPLNVKSDEHVETIASWLGELSPDASETFQSLGSAAVAGNVDLNEDYGLCLY